MVLQYLAAGQGEKVLTASRHCPPWLQKHLRPSDDQMGKMLSLFAGKRARKVSPNGDNQDTGS